MTLLGALIKQMTAGYMTVLLEYTDNNIDACVSHYTTSGNDVHRFSYS